LFMAKGFYVFVWRLQYSDNHRIIKHFSLFYYIILVLAKLKAIFVKSTEKHESVVYSCSSDT